MIETHTPYVTAIMAVAFILGLQKWAHLFLIPVLIIEVVLGGEALFGNPGFLCQMMAAAVFVHPTRIGWIAAMVASVWFQDRSSALSLIVGACLSTKRWWPLVGVIWVASLSKLSNIERGWLLERSLALIGDHPWGVDPSAFLAYVKGQVEPGRLLHMESSVLTVIAAMGVWSVLFTPLLWKIPRRWWAAVPTLMFEAFYLPAFFMVAPRRWWAAALALVVYMNEPTYDRQKLGILAVSGNKEAQILHDTLTRERLFTVDEPLVEDPKEWLTRYRNVFQKR